MIRTKGPGPCQEKQLHTITWPPPWLRVFIVFFGWYAWLGRHQTYFMPSEPSRLILDSSENNIFIHQVMDAVRCSSANRMRASMWCGCSFRTFRGLWAQNPALRKRRDTVFDETCNPSSCLMRLQVVKGSALTFSTICASTLAVVFCGRPVDLPVASLRMALSTNVR